MKPKQNRGDGLRRKMAMPRSHPIPSSACVPVRFFSALLQDNPCYTESMIHEKDVMAVVRKIVEGVHPEKVIAFGSWAEGRAGRDSDLDILVIMPLKPGEKRFIKSGEIRAIAGDTPFPMDILVRSPEDIERRLSLGDYFVRNILDHGRTLHQS